MGFVVGGVLRGRFRETVCNALWACLRSLRGRLLESLYSAKIVEVGVSDRRSWRVVSKRALVLEQRCETVCHACFLLRNKSVSVKLRIE